jgi:hypothetical protein
MIFDVNKKNLDILAATGCPRNLWGVPKDFHCMISDDDIYYDCYNGSALSTCRACWLKWLSEESEGNHE